MPFLLSLLDRIGNILGLYNRYAIRYNKLDWVCALTENPKSEFWGVEIMADSRRMHYSLGFFNAARGMAALFVIIGHSMALFLKHLPMPQQTLFAGAGRVLGAGVMAMLFMVSGFYFQRRPVKRCLQTQSRLLLKPYVLTGLAILAGLWVRSRITGSPFRDTGLNIAATYLLGLNASRGITVLGIRLGTVSLFWFVLALYWGWIILNRIEFLKTATVRALVITACVVAGWALTNISTVWPMALPMALLAVGYLAAGSQIRNRQLLDKRIPFWAWLVILPVLFVSLALGNVDIAGCTWKLGLVDVAASFFVGYLMLRFYCRWMTRKTGGLYLRRTDNLGIHSLRILCMHAFEKEVIPWGNLIRLFPEHPLLCVVLCIAGRLLAIQVLIILLEKVRKFLHRKKRIKLEITEE